MVVPVFQYVSEKIGGAKGTELDDEFIEMEKVSLNSFPLPHFTMILSVVYEL